VGKADGLMPLQQTEFEEAGLSKQHHYDQRGVHLLKALQMTA
jgi:hypothetical protein